MVFYGWSERSGLPLPKIHGGTHPLPTPEHTARSPRAVSHLRRTAVRPLSPARTTACPGDRPKTLRPHGPVPTIQNARPAQRGPGIILWKKPRRVRARRRESSSDPFSPATCASGKTLLRLQAWVLSACGGQNLRAADCIFLETVALPLFRESQAGADGSAPGSVPFFSCGRRAQPVCCSFFSRVIPPTPTLTAATVRPVMDSTLLFTASCTARPTSGMVCP